MKSGTRLYSAIQLTPCPRSHTSGKEILALTHHHSEEEEGACEPGAFDQETYFGNDLSSCIPCSQTINEFLSIRINKYSDAKKIQNNGVMDVQPNESERVS